MQHAEPVRGTLFSLAEVLSRMAVRIVVLAVFAAASSQPFWPVLTTLLVVAAGLSTVMAVARRETLLGPTLNHWDEAAFYALLSRGLALAIAAVSIPAVR